MEPNSPASSRPAAAVKASPLAGGGYSVAGAAPIWMARRLATEPAMHCRQMYGDAEEAVAEADAGEACDRSSAGIEPSGRRVARRIVSKCGGGQ